MDTTTNLGTENLVNTAVDILNTAQSVANAASDGIGVTDLVTLLQVAPALNRIRKTGRPAIEELLDLSVEESREVVAQIAFRTGNPQTGLLQKVNEAFTLLANTYTVFRAAEVATQDWVRFGKSLKKAKA